MLLATAALPPSGNDTTVGPWRPSSPPQMGGSVDTKAVNEILHSPFFSFLLALEEILLAKAKMKLPSMWTIVPILGIRWTHHSFLMVKAPVGIAETCENFREISLTALADTLHLVWITPS